ncbi:MAG: LysR family transcriptional regulator [Bordetella sp. SCN 67-23]|nr:LysR family transcriptional regulator [Burkholderiales bacterium]ODS74372.1 MAG: LysR family transcriptional regulator [Bordetella sp. SCN 67-23]ODU83946.1 MAG: LysR family transcriptional regulator [Bordetella sp. SCN 68-11]OJW89593.1 MAG: LysR family transcriptional regulator [Burkholderiales bacterium 67-32]
MDWTHRLRLRNLQMLLSLAQTRNISHSAAALNTTQPALSKWLRELEDDIGLPLFERHARGLRPTSYGEALIAHARRLETQLDRAHSDMEAMREGGSGQVLIGTSGAAAPDTVPLAMLALLRRMPQARIRVVESTMDHLMEQLAGGELDIVVGRSAPEMHDPAIRSEALYLEPIHFVARPYHPLFEGGEPTWDAVTRYRWILWPKGTPIRNALDAALAAAGRALPVDHVESNSATLNMTLLAHSDMVGVASHRAAMRLVTMNAVRIVPLRLSGFGSVEMYWRNDALRPAGVEAALECLREVVRGQGEP